MIGRTIRILVFLLSVGLLALTLGLTWEFPTLAQSLPGLSWSEDDISSDSYIPVFTSENLELAPVFLDGKMVRTVESFIQLSSGKDDSRGDPYSAAVRSQIFFGSARSRIGRGLYPCWGASWS